MSGFIASTGEDLDKTYISQYELIDRYAMGTLWGWGKNDFGQLSDFSNTNRSSPVQVSVKGFSWRNVSCGYNQAGAIRSDNTLWMAGNNSKGQLGDGTTTNRNVQTQLAGTDWRSVSTSISGSHTVALKINGTIWSWGNNANGQLGSGTTTNRSSPVQIGTATDNSWKQISSGGDHTFGIKNDGSLWAWGYNYNGQLGDGTTFNRSSPVQIGSSSWTSVSGGGIHGAAIRSDGTLWTWGTNSAGQLGYGSSLANRSSPVQVGTASNWMQVSAGLSTTGSIQYNGTLWTWGYNNWGQIGDGTTINKSSPVQVGTATNWKQVSIGHINSAAIKTDGTLWSWGHDAYGELGDGTTVSRSSPVQVYVNGNNWKQVSSGFGYARATQYSYVEQVL